MRGPQAAALPAVRLHVAVRPVVAVAAPRDLLAPMSRLAWSSVSERLPGRRAITDRSGVRQLSYAPDLDGTADPGEVVWATVTFEEDDQQVKDRPLLVVARKDDDTVLALLLSSRAHRRRVKGWLDLGRGAWDAQRRRSYVRLDRVLELADDGLRREGAVLAPQQFERVCVELRRGYGWR